MKTRIYFDLLEQASLNYNGLSNAYGKNARIDFGCGAEWQRQLNLKYIMELEDKIKHLERFKEMYINQIQ